MRSPITDSQAGLRAPHPPRTTEEAERREARQQAAEPDPAPRPVITDWASL